MEKKKLMLLTYVVLGCNIYSQRADHLVKASIKNEDSCRIKIRRLALNSGFSDFSPFVHNNQLMFVSGRTHRLGVEYTSDNTNSEFTDLFTATSVDSVKFKRIRSFSNTINTKYNEGSFTINREGNVIYFTGSYGGQKLKILRSQKTDNGWTEPQTLAFCREEFSYCHPSLSPDEKILVFCSDMNGGFGGMDLYAAHMVSGKWSDIQNLGPKINGSFNEVFPFAGLNGSLYFSSDKKGGMGGLDLYITDLNNSGTPQLLTHPLNSAGDDFGIWVDSTGENGYFSTSRDSRYKDDIYYFNTWLPDFSDSKKPIVKSQFCYSFFEESTLHSKDTIHLTYEWDFGDGTKLRALRAKHCYSKPGSYPVKLNIIEKVSGKIFKTEETYMHSVDPPPQLTIACGDTAMLGSDFIIDSERSALKGYQINRVFWSFGDGRFNAGPKVKHHYTRQGDFLLELWVIAKNEKTQSLEKFKIDKKIFVKTRKNK